VLTRSFRIGAAAPQALAGDVTLRVSTVAGDVAGQRAAITFTPDGSSSGGRIDLATGQRTVGVAVDWLTGRVSVADAP
jgi:general secretion pathway protein H